MTAMEQPVRCPDSWWVPGAIGPLYVVGCGHTFMAAPDDEGLVDCPNCGIWFLAEHAVTVWPTYSANKWMVTCICSWISVSTGPKAQERVRRHGERHILNNTITGVPT